VSTWQEKHGHNIEWKQGGYTFVAYRDEEEATLKELLKTQRRFGLNINWYDAEEFRRIVPDVVPSGLRGGTFSAEDGHCSTLLAGHAFYDAAKQAGAVFRFGEQVIGIDVRNGSVCGVTTPTGTYRASVVVNAAGPWAQEVGRLVGHDHPVVPDSHEGGITEPVAQFLDPMVVDISPGPGSSNYYFFQLATGQVVFCITPSPVIPGEDRRETSSFLPMVAKRMVRLMPRLANLRIRRTWRGLYPMTPDGSPLIGWSREVEGYLIAVGMCGQGFMLGLGVGELLTRMVVKPRGELGESDREILTILSPYREFASTELLK
jgi:sarcosine oxidase subunit beta